MRDQCWWTDSRSALCVAAVASESAESYTITFKRTRSIAASARLKAVQHGPSSAASASSAMPPLAYFCCVCHVWSATNCPGYGSSVMTSDPAHTRVETNKNAEATTEIGSIDPKRGTPTKSAHPSQSGRSSKAIGERQASIGTSGGPQFHVPRGALRSPYLVASRPKGTTVRSVSGILRCSPCDLRVCFSPTDSIRIRVRWITPLE